jgi:hypothetical protein
MDLLGWLKKLHRERDQLTVELAERGVAPEDEVRATEERIEAHGERRPPEPPGDASARR